MAACIFDVQFQRREENCCETKWPTCLELFTEGELGGRFVRSEMMNVSASKALILPWCHSVARKHTFAVKVGLESNGKHLEECFGTPHDDIQDNSTPSRVVFLQSLLSWEWLWCVCLFSHVFALADTNTFTNGPDWPLVIRKWSIKSAAAAKKQSFLLIFNETPSDPAAGDGNLCWFLFCFVPFWIPY